MTDNTTAQPSPYEDEIQAQDKDAWQLLVQHWHPKFSDISLFVLTRPSPNAAQRKPASILGILEKRLKQLNDKLTHTRPSCIFRTRPTAYVFAATDFGLSHGVWYRQANPEGIYPRASNWQQSRARIAFLTHRLPEPTVLAKPRTISEHLLERLCPVVCTVFICFLTQRFKKEYIM